MTSPADRRGFEFALAQTAEFQRVASTAPESVRADMGRPSGEWADRAATLTAVAPFVASAAMKLQQQNAA